ncbi:MAG: molybdopterin-binding protein [Promethearchaeota archaeon]
MEYLSALSYQRFLEKVTAHEPVEGVEAVPLSPEALGRVCSSDVRSPVDVPHFRRAMRDGFAVRARDTFGAEETTPKPFQLLEQVAAGDVPTATVGEGQCSYVATGAAVPEGADAVVMVEYSEERGGRVWLSQAVTPGQWVVPVGKDVAAGSVVVEAGTVLTPAKLGALAATGHREVEVFRKPRVATFSTGNEILEPGEELVPGKVYDVNSTTLAALLVQAGAEVRHFGRLPDDAGPLERTLRRAVAEFDLVVASGGTSKGKEDLMPGVLRNAPEVTELLHGARMKPGKPVLYARWARGDRDVPVVVLPGYPTSAAVTCLFLVDPLVRKLARKPPRTYQKTTAVLSERVYSEAGRQEFKAVFLSEREDGTVMAKPVPKGSESITTLASASGLFVVEPGRTIVEEGTRVEVLLLP